MGNSMLNGDGQWTHHYTISNPFLDMFFLKSPPLFILAVLLLLFRFSFLLLSLLLFSGGGGRGGEEEEVKQQFLQPVSYGSCTLESMTTKLDESESVSK